METKTSTSGESPLKEWVKKHSPLKNRKNKPLPPAPVSTHESPTRKAVGPISGNANASTTSLNNETKRPKKRISSLLGHRKSSSATDKAPSQVIFGDAKPTKRPRSRDNQAAAGNAERPNKQPRLAQSPGSFSRLSERVSSLEAQLQAAQKELEHFRGGSAGGSVRPPPRRTKSFDVDQDVVTRQTSLSGFGRFDGLVENLLVAQRSVSPLPTLTPEGSRSRRGCSVDAGRVPAERARPKSRNPKAEATFEMDLKDEHERRRALRSQLRQSSWHNIQEHMATQTQKRSYSAGSKHSLADDIEAERPARRQKQTHEKQLPTPPNSHAYVEDSGSGLAGGRGSSVAPKYLPRDQESSRASRKHSGSKKPDTIPEENDVELHPSATDIEKAEIKTAIEVDVRPQSPWRHHVPSPSHLPAVSEEFEWNDEEIF